MEKELSRQIAQFAIGLKYADLPANARALVEHIEQHTAPVTHVCVGPERDQVLTRS